MYAVLLWVGKAFYLLEAFTCLLEAFTCLWADFSPFFSLSSSPGLCHWYWILCGLTFRHGRGTARTCYQRRYGAQGEIPIWFSQSEWVSANILLYNCVYVLIYALCITIQYSNTCILEVRVFSPKISPKNQPHIPSLAVFRHSHFNNLWNFYLTDWLSSANNWKGYWRDFFTAWRCFILRHAQPQQLHSKHHGSTFVFLCFPVFLLTMQGVDIQ